MDLTKILSIGGMALTVVGSLISGVASNRKMKETIAKEVSDHISKLSK